MHGARRLPIAPADCISSPVTGGSGSGGGRASPSSRVAAAREVLARYGHNNAPWEAGHLDRGSGVMKTRWRRVGLRVPCSGLGHGYCALQRGLSVHWTENAEKRRGVRSVPAQRMWRKSNRNDTESGAGECHTLGAISDSRSLHLISRTQPLPAAWSASATAAKTRADDITSKMFEGGKNAI
ncbi:hypothetical protein E1301_Tti017992 [Triplophysa tibetana]|uniref:Uncharacterized protein n=1 Tax=Triplophysa tibetana TaxID=1572043 RepID=A0A5A9NK93_9TELE|nr:hypothetical protein E1301_Tti017992 [Triplophysa tibetana]